MKNHSYHLLLVLLCIPVSLPIYAMDVKEAKAGVTYGQAAQAFLTRIPEGKPSPKSKPAEQAPDASALRQELAAAKARIAQLEKDKTQLTATVALKDAELKAKKDELATANGLKDTYYGNYTTYLSRFLLYQDLHDKRSENAKALLPILLKAHAHAMLGIVIEAIRLANMTPYAWSHRTARRERRDELEKKILQLETLEKILEKICENPGIPSRYSVPLYVQTVEVLKAMKNISSQTKTYLDTGDRHWGHQREREFLEHVQENVRCLERVMRQLN